MKNIFFKQFLLIALLMVSGVNSLRSQNVGGTNSNQSAPKEVKAAELSKGAYTSDVNLFTGTMATSYDLGSVSTFAGMSYNLKMNYSSTRTVGQNPGIVTGISYGDGWNINIPTISVSVDAYRAYAGVVTSGSNCTDLDLSQARSEGHLSWYAPFINIPGVVSERFILKTIDTLRNELVFVPNIMEKYVEARLKQGSSWSVTDHNGDVYSFHTGAMTNYRAAPQLNYVDPALKNTAGLREANLVPREEPITWYCDQIYNKNSPSNQGIAFQYEVFGQFDFFKEFMQPTLNQGLGMKVGNSLGFSSFKLNRDILLVAIESYSERGSIEKLELNYKTILPPSQASKNMLLLSDNSVKRLDSLNNYRIVFSHGVSNTSEALAINSYGFSSGLSFNNGNTPNTGFSGWRRYMHVMHPAVAPFRSPFATLGGAFMHNSNPYLMNDGTAGSYLFNSASSSGANSELDFDHGFLESPRIFNDIVPGDIYEVKSYIKNYNVANQHLQICNFDINIVSGTSSENLNAFNKVSGQDFISGSRGLTVFSTFNNPVKWTSLAHNIVGSQQPPNTFNGLIATSNFFLMPALPKNFNGMNVQIGPSNSDHDFSLDMQTSTMRFLDINPNGPSKPSAFFAYKYLQSLANSGQRYPGECLLSPFKSAPNNFGIGLPWYMMNEVYTELSDDPAHEDQVNSGNYNFWWRDALSNNNSVHHDIDNYSNVPTAADQNVSLAACEIVRYSKNPYMLYSAKKYKFNGYNYSDTLPKNKFLVNQLDFGYSFKTDSLFSYKITGKDFIGFQNVYLLATIRQIPVNGAMANAPTTFVESDLPTTHFVYSRMNSDNLIGTGTKLKFTGNIYLMSKIVDQLGGTMKYEYYPIEDGVHTRFYNIYLDNNYCLVKPFDYYNLPSPDLYKVQIAVKEKTYFNSASATIPLKTWQYDYFDALNSTLSNDGTPVLGRSSIPAISPNYIHNSQNLDFGFLITTVKYPQLNSNTIVPFDRYTHFNSSENDNLTFGKLKKVEKFDAAGQILSKKEFEYKASMAFGNFLFTGNTVVSDYFNETQAEYTRNYINTSPSYAIPLGSQRSYYFNRSLMSFSGRDIDFLEYGNMSMVQGINHHTYPNSYFVRIVKETNTDYDYSFSPGEPSEIVAQPQFRGVNLGDAPVEDPSTSGINSIKLEMSLLTSSNPSLIMSGRTPLMIANPMTTITEYDYWDGDYIGISESFGFEKLLNEDATVQNSTVLTYEPSFELFRTKTYSPHLAGAFTSTEYYYYYDLKQDIMQLNPANIIYHTPQYFDAFNYSHKYLIRNLMYQKTITSKAATQPAIAKSEYYWYDTRTKTDTVFMYDTLYIDFDFCNVTPPDTSSNSTPWTPDPTPVDPSTLGCYQVPHPFELPQPGYTFSEVSPGNWWYCPSATGPSTERNAARYLNLPSDMKTKLILRRIDEQIDTIPESLTYFNKFHPILRFKELYTSGYAGGPLNIPLNEYAWFTPYKTKTKYKALEHTQFGQVRLEMNERGLKTRYNYQTVFSTTFIDLTGPPCPTNPGGAYNLTDQGVPKCITVGSGLPDSLTTCYSYNKDYTINTITDPNGMVLSYQYDNFSRMTAAVRNNELLSTNQYSQWLNDTTLTYEQRADQNYVESYILLNNGSTVAEHSRAYIDPLGRKYDVQTQVTSNYSNPSVFDTLMVHSGLTTYDNWDRVLRQYKPFKHTNGGSSVMFAPTFNPTANFAEQQYEGNQRGRVLRASKFGENINTGHTVNSTYQVISGLQLKVELGSAFGNANIYDLAGVLTQNMLQYQRYLKTSSIDEDSKKTVTYTNVFGQKVATKTYANSIGQEITGFVYDSQGNLKKVINPNLQKTTYEYNLSGNMYRKVSVDADTCKYLYDVSGNVVLEQDANGKHGRNELDNKLYMRKYTYDIFGRMIEQDRVHYNTKYDPLRYYPFIYGDTATIDTTKTFYQFTNTATLDFYGGWIVQKCIIGGNVYRTTPPTGGTIGPVNPLDPGWDPEPSDPGNPPASPCSMIYGYVGDSLTLSAPEKKWAYHFPVDVTDTDLGTTALNNLPGSNYLKGRLSMAKSYNHPGDFSNLNIYGYNNVGLMAKELTQFNLPDGSNITSIINYNSYNLRNSLLEQEIDSDADGITDISYKYNYDGWNRLRQALVKKGIIPFRRIATYDYNDALGLVTKTKYYDLYSTCNLPIDSITYSYDTRNRLTKIGSTLYDEKLYYDGNQPILDRNLDVTSYGYYNGNIRAVVHNYKLNPATNYASTAGIMDSSTVYGYTYDGLNRLTRADASVLNVLNLNSGPSTYGPRKKFGDETMTYDPIGNISSIARGLYYNPTVPTPANYMQQWVYNYQTNNNRLVRIDSLSNTPLRQYEYDNNGNQTSELVNNRQATTRFMRSNLPENTLIDEDITTIGDNTNVNYSYNANDDRLFKDLSIFRINKKVYYLRDASGKELAEFDVTNNSWKYYAYGRERVAEISGNNVLYNIYDHLGSVRLIYGAQGNCHGLPILYNLESSLDYYAFGKTLRSFNNSKFSFTGKERDAETNLDYFGARKYDSEIGRWTSNDPLRDKYPSMTPYNYAANNPAFYIDPDGKDIVDSQGRKIAVINNESGNIEFTEHATAKVKEILGVLNSTEVGKGVLTDAITATHNIEFTISSKAVINGGITDRPKMGGSIRLGETLSQETMDNKEFASSKVIVYEGSVKQYQKEGKDADYNGAKVSLDKYSTKVATASTAIHELTHATDKGSNPDIVTTMPGTQEIKPKENQKKFIEEINQQNQQR